ncbi:thiamine pyrophosphate-binding protein [Mesorhizobium sp. M0772]
MAAGSGRQELDHIALFQACAKWVRRVVVAERVDDYINAAFASAASGRPGPAVLLPAMRHANPGQWPLDRMHPDASTSRRLLGP